MIYLYGLVEPRGAEIAVVLKDTEGLQGPLQHAEIAGWTLVYSDHDDQEILPKRRLLLAHTKVLELLLTIGTTLPARFGLVARDLGQVAVLIQSVRDTIAAEFDKIRDAVELGVRVSFPRDAALATTLQQDPRLQTEHANLQKSGAQAHFAIAEFGGRLADQMERRRGQAQRQLMDALRPHARNCVLRKPEDDTEVLRAEFLIDQNIQDIFEQKIADAAADLDFAPGEEPMIQIIGPVPMYNFVSLNLTFDLDQVA